MVRNAECMVRNSVFIACITYITPRILGFRTRITVENNQCIILPVDGYMMH